MLKALSKRLRKNQKGFTLIELIVVIAILAILAAIIFPSVSGIINKAKHTTGVSDARSVYIAAQSVAQDKMTAGNQLTAGNAYSSGITDADLNKVLGSNFISADKVTIVDIEVDDTGNVTYVIIAEKGIPGDNGGTTITYPQSYSSSPSST